VALLDATSSGFGSSRPARPGQPEPVPRAAEEDVTDELTAFGREQLRRASDYPAGRETVPAGEIYPGREAHGREAMLQGREACSSEPVDMTVGSY